MTRRSDHAEPAKFTRNPDDLLPPLALPDARRDLLALMQQSPGGDGLPLEWMLDHKEARP